jgi:hypothetical protein
MKEKNNDQLREPEIAYRKKRIQFSSSFEEEEEVKRKMMAAMPAEERMKNPERMRKHFLSHRLTADGKWKPLKRIITIYKGSFQRPSLKILQLRK